MRVFAPLGYGVLHRGGFASWFCLLDTPFRELRDWWQLTRQRAAVERITATFGATQRELAGHEVYLTLSGAGRDRPVPEPPRRAEVCRLAGDPIGHAVLEGFLADSGEQVLFGEVTRAASALSR